MIRGICGPPHAGQDITFIGGNTCRPGMGIIRMGWHADLRPDASATAGVFIHNGDSIYADIRSQRRSTGRRHHLEERRDSRESEGGRDARGIPG